MEAAIAIIQERISRVDSRLMTGIQVLLGSLYIALLAQLEIPLTPVPVTLHTFAIMTLALYMGKNKAALSALLYLGEATLGLPVFPSFWSDPLWMLHPTAGYCISFPFAAYLIGFLAESKGRPGFVRILASVLAGKAVIYLFGVLWLTYFVGISQAVALGFVPFLFVLPLKVGAAVSMKMATERLRPYLLS